MTYTVMAPRDGLGIADWVIPLLASIGGTVGGAVATRLLVGPSTPTQREVEAAIKAQTRADIERMYAGSQIQQQQVEELGPYLVPALGVLALVMLLR